MMLGNALALGTCPAPHVAVVAPSLSVVATEEPPTCTAVLDNSMPETILGASRIWDCARGVTVDTGNLVSKISEQVVGTSVEHVTSSLTLRPNWYASDSDFGGYPSCGCKTSSTIGMQNTSTASLSQPHTIVYVGCHTAVSANQYWNDGNSSSSRWVVLLSSALKPQINAGSTQELSTAAIVAVKAFVAFLVVNGASSTAYIYYSDGTTTSGTVAGSVGTGAGVGMSLFNRYNNANTCNQRFTIKGFVPGAIATDVRDNFIAFLRRSMAFT